MRDPLQAEAGLSMLRPRVLRHVVRKEFLQIFRDHQMVRILLLMPVLQVILLGYAITSDVRDLPLAVLDHDRSPESRELTEHFRHHDAFQIVGSVSGPEQMRSLLDRGIATAVLVIPTGFSRDLFGGAGAQVQMLVDGVDSNASQIAAAQAVGITRAYAIGLMRRRLRGMDLPDIEPRITVLYNPEMESRYFMVPGIVVLILAMLTSILTSLGLVRERETGTLEQLSVTPIRSLELILGKLMPFAVIAVVILALLLLVVLFWFGVPMRGSWTLLAAFAGLFLLNTLGLGLFISTVAHSQQQALFMAWFFNVFAIIMSGLFFPISNMPESLQYLTYLNPVRYFLAVTREIFLKGSGLAGLQVEALGLLIVGPLAMLGAALRFRKRAR
ncbi:ABC transporter permease [Gemmatimonadota bacterium]